MVIVLAPVCSEMALDADPEATAAPFTVTVAPAAATVGVTVVLDVALATDIEYAVVPLENAGDSAPADTARADRSALALGTTVKLWVVLEIAEPPDPMEAWRSTLPALWPMRVKDAAPWLGVPVPAMLTAPVPAVCATVIVSVAVVTVLPAASVIRAVAARVAPTDRFAVDTARSTPATDPGATVKALALLVIDAAVAVTDTDPARAPSTVLVATPATALIVAGSGLTVPAPVWANVTAEVSPVAVLP
jgi:hypothetical protein